MNAVYAAAADLQEFVQSKGWPFCFIGGIAVQRWAYPRATDDADMTVFTQVFRDEECIRELLKRFAPFYSDAAEKAPMLRVLFMQHPNGVRIDVALGAFDFEEHAVARASWWEPTKGMRLFTCSAEDLIVHKAYASRPQDLADIENMPLSARPASRCETNPSGIGTSRGIEGGQRHHHNAGAHAHEARPDLRGNAPPENAGRYSTLNRIEAVLPLAITLRM